MIMKKKRTCLQGKSFDIKSQIAKQFSSNKRKGENEIFKQ